MTEHFTFDTAGAYKDLLLTDLSFTRSTHLASLYGVQPWDGASVYPHMPAGERAGILTRGSFLVNDNDTTHPIHRGVTIKRRILCEEIAPPDPASLPAGALVPPPVTADMTTRQRYRTRRRPRCATGATGRSTQWASCSSVTTLSAAPAPKRWSSTKQRAKSWRPCRSTRRQHPRSTTTTIALSKPGPSSAKWSLLQRARSSLASLASTSGLRTRGSKPRTTAARWKACVARSPGAETWATRCAQSLSMRASDRGGQCNGKPTWSPHFPPFRRGSAARASVPPVAPPAQAVGADQAGHQEARRYPLVERSVRDRLVPRLDATGLPAPRYDVRRPSCRWHHRAPRNDAEHAAQVGAAIGLRIETDLQRHSRSAQPVSRQDAADPRPRSLAGHQSRSG